MNNQNSIQHSISQRAVTAERIAQELGGKKTSTGWSCKCPAHDDKSPSLSLSNGSDGRALVKCHAGCSQAAVIDALKSRGLWSTTSSEAPRTTEYVYFTESKQPLHKVVRLDYPDGKKKIFQKHLENGQWVNGALKGALLPYMYDKWENERERWVFLVEGEKAVEALVRRGFLATTTVGGSQGWRNEYGKHFEGRMIAILPDNDEPGFAYAESAASSLLPVAKSLKVINLPTLEAKEDVFDWFEKGNSAATLKELVLKANEHKRDGTTIVTKETAKSDSIALPLPHAIQSEAYYGLAGEFVKLVEPCTESDAAALLIQFLVAFGNVIGRSAYLEIEADRHYCNLFAVIVGESSKGRKGTSLGHVKRLFSLVDGEWWVNCKASGLTSGEGVASAVKDPAPVDLSDPSYKPEKPKDKRLLCIETEFASVLRAIQREGNTLSSALRDAWDHGDLRTLTKKDPVRATGAHISVIGHITRVELLKLLSQTEVFNGFGNRFIWVASKRSKLLPLGGRLDPYRLASIQNKLDGAVTATKNRGVVSLSSEAAELYTQLYYDLATEKPGLAGVLTSRAEPIILRLALTYALLDQSPEILPDHLRAAVALWDYAEASVNFIFGGSTGNREADTILGELRESPEGLSQTHIVETVFKRNMPKAKLSEAFDLLKKFNLAHVKKVTGIGGRPVNQWFLTPTSYEFNEVRNENSYLVRSEMGEKCI